MKPSIAVKTVIASTVHVSGVLDGILKRRRGAAAILMYHRVLPREDAKRLSVQSGMFVQPDTFETHLRFLADHFELIPLRDLPGIPGGKNGSAKPKCILTFDDGWSDFWIHAFPLLQRHGVPATVFLPTDYIGGKSRFWTDRLTDLFAGGGGDSSAPAGLPDDLLACRIAMLKGDRETRLEAAIRILKGHREEDIERVLAVLSPRNTPADGSGPGRDFTSWDEVRHMGASGLVSYGSHTASHRILTTLSREEVRGELERSRERLLAEEAADAAFIPFCYPNGGYDAGVAAMVREAGYHLGVTTEGGWNGPDHDPFALRRIGIHEDMASTPALFGCRVAGIL